MSATFLVIHLRTVDGAPGHGVVNVNFNHGSKQAVTGPSNPTQPGSFEIRCPDALDHIHLSVDESSNFWNVEFPLEVTRDGAGRPQTVWQPIFAFTDAMTHRRGRQDWELHVTITLLSITDATLEMRTLPEDISVPDPVSSFFEPKRTGAPDAGNCTNFSYPGTRIMPPIAPGIVKHVADPPNLVDEVGPGWTRLNHEPKLQDAPQGRIYFFKTKLPAGPTLFAVWRPAYLNFPNPIGDDRVDYHVFFHPFVNPNITGNGSYPFSAGYASVAHRYLFTAKFLVMQHFAARRKVLLVFPVGSNANQFGGLDWSTLHGLLREINFAVQRTETSSIQAWRFRQVGLVAVSGFSAGIQFAERILATSAGDPREDALREVYSFDGTDEHTHGGGMVDFIPLVASWVQKRPSRVFRVYTQNSAAAMLADPNVFGRAHAVSQINRFSFAIRIREHEKDPRTETKHTVQTVEAHDTWPSLASTVLIVPNVFWRHIIAPFVEGRINLDANPPRPMTALERYAGAVHQFIPSYFCHHAIKSSPNFRVAP